MIRKYWWSPGARSGINSAGLVELLVQCPDGGWVAPKLLRHLFVSCAAAQHPNRDTTILYCHVRTTARILRHRMSELVGRSVGGERSKLGAMLVLVGRLELRRENFCHVTVSAA